MTYKITNQNIDNHEITNQRIKKLKLFAIFCSQSEHKKKQKFKINLLSEKLEIIKKQSDLSKILIINQNIEIHQNVKKVRTFKIRKNKVLCSILYTRFFIIMNKGPVSKEKKSELN